MFRFLPHCGVAKTGTGPVAGFARSNLTARQRNPDGLRLLSRPAARYRRSAKGLPPAWPTTFADPSGSGSERKYGTGEGCGDEKGADFG